METFGRAVWPGQETRPQQFKSLNLQSESEIAKRQIEREFGVPIAGEILDQSLWTQTALKRLPAEGPLDLTHLFGRAAPLVVDLGCGNGRYLLSSSVWRPDHDHVG